MNTGPRSSESHVALQICTRRRGRMPYTLLIVESACRREGTHGGGSWGGVGGNDDRLDRLRRLGRGSVLVPIALPTRTDVVPLDHLVERCRFDVQQLCSALLHAARGLERCFDETLLEVG